MCHLKRVQVSPSRCKGLQKTCGAVKNEIFNAVVIFCCCCCCSWGPSNPLIFVFVLLGALQALVLFVGSSRPLVGSGSNLQPEIAQGGVRTPADDQISAIGCRPTPYPRCCSGRRDIYQPMALGIFERMYHTFFGRRKPCSKRVFFSESVEF